MRENQSLIDDLMTLSGNLLGNILGARHEMKAQAKQRMESVARRLDLISRSEFDIAFAMLAKTRKVQDELGERLSLIESCLNLSPSIKVKKTKGRAKVNLLPVKKGHQKLKRK